MRYYPLSSCRDCRQYRGHYAEWKESIGAVRYPSMCQIVFKSLENEEEEEFKEIPDWCPLPKLEDFRRHFKNPD